jgi:hypothetical protein
LIDGLRIWGMVVSVVGAVVVMPEPLTRVWRRVRDRLQSPAPARVRISRITARVTTLARDDTPTTGAAVWSAIDLELAPIRGHVGDHANRLDRIEGALGSTDALNRRGFWAIVAGGVLTGWPDHILPTWLVGVWSVVGVVVVIFAVLPLRHLRS